MAVITVSTTTNFDTIVRAAGDTFSITSGAVLTIDGDTRYDLNGGVELGLGSIAIDSSSGGSILVDATHVRLIPFNAGSGTVPTCGTAITQAGVTGKLVGVWSEINVAPVAVGVAMPATGYIKVKQVVGTYAAGAIGGISASATGADKEGWIEIVGDEGATCTIPQLGEFKVTGDWFDAGTTTGSSATTYQLPTSGTAKYFPGIFVETSVASNVFEFYPCMGTLAGAGTVGTDAFRGKVCWIPSTTGALRFGSDGANLVGYVPLIGLRIRLPNVMFVSCTVAARGVTALPSATLSNRYDFTTTSGGSVNIDKASINWYLSLSYASSVDISNSGMSDRTYLTYCGSIKLNNSGIGQSAVQNQGSAIYAGMGASIALTNVTVAGAFFTGGIVIASIADVILSDVKSTIVGGSAYVALNLIKIQRIAINNLKLIGGYISADIADAVMARLLAGHLPVNAVQMNDAPIIGDGTEGNRWRGVGVPG